MIDHTRTEKIDGDSIYFCGHPSLARNRYDTAHFIDNDWKLNKKILNFCSISSHKGEAISMLIKNACLVRGLRKFSLSQLIIQVQMMLLLGT